MKTLPQNDVEYQSALEQEIIVMTLTSVTRLFELSAEAATLYLFYCKNAKIQSNNIGYTNKIRADDIFCRQGLHWGQEKFYRTKKILQQEGFIEDVARRSADGKLGNHYVKINFLPKSGIQPHYSNEYSGDKDAQGSGTDQPRNHSTQNQSMAKPEYGKQITNAENKNRNADNKKKKTSTSDSNVSLDHIGSQPSPQGYRPNESHNNPRHIASPLNSKTHDAPMGDRKSGCTSKNCLVECTLEEIWSIADRKNVSLNSVIRIHQSVIDSVLSGNKYKTKSVYLTTNKWVDLALSRGNIDTLSKEERMILDWQNPEREKRLRAKAQELIKQKQKENE